MGNACPEHGDAGEIGTDYLRAFVDGYIAQDRCEGCIAAARAEIAQRESEVIPTEHTLTLYRDDDRLGHHYGEHYYVERVNGVEVKSERLSTHDRSTAYTIAEATARLYGARLVDRRPDASLYGWSAD